MQWKVQAAIPAEASGETPRPLTAGRPPSHHELRSCMWESDGLREALFTLSILCVCIRVYDSLDGISRVLRLF